jgi:hypothetical protein
MDAEQLTSFVAVESPQWGALLRASGATPE